MNKKVLLIVEGNKTELGFYTHLLNKALILAKSK